MAALVMVVDIDLVLCTAWHLFHGMTILLASRRLRLRLSDSGCLRASSFLSLQSCRWRVLILVAGPHSVNERTGVGSQPLRNEVGSRLKYRRGVFSVWLRRISGITIRNVSDTSLAGVRCLSCEMYAYVPLQYPPTIFLYPCIGSFCIHFRTTVRSMLSPRREQVVAEDFSPMPNARCLPTSRS